MNSQQTGIISIIKSAITGEKCLLPKDFDLESAIKIAKRHQILALFYYGALNCGFSKDLPIMKQLFIDTFNLVSISEQQMYATNKLFARFDENKIDYMPLKGTLLKKMYPLSEMREMGDADILIRTEQYDKIIPIMQSLGFTELLESDHEFVWNKQRIHIELHKRLIPSYNKDYYAYFGDGWSLGKPISNDSTHYAMTAEDEFIYLFTHYAKHYRTAGIGIRHIVDLWVYRNNFKNLNKKYLLTEFKKLQLDVFYHNTMRTLDVWFKDLPSDDITQFITNTIFNSGVYGTHEAQLLSDAIIASKQIGTTKTARINKVLFLVFLPYKSMCQKYPILKKVSILLPVMWVVRLFDVLLFRRENIKKSNNDLKIMSAKKIENYQQALNFVGLDFNFKE